MTDLRRQLIQRLKKHGLTLAIAESVTCGLAANKLSTLPGLSEVFIGSIVCYTPEMKMSLLNVAKKTIEDYTCESAQVTNELATNLSQLLKADFNAAITGLASPGGSETKSKPVGTVFVSVYFRNRIHNKRIIFRGSPVQIRKKACDALFVMILSILKNTNEKVFYIQK